MNNTNLTSRIGRLNLDWVDLDQSQERENEAFQHAVTLAGSEFLEVYFCWDFLNKNVFSNHLVYDGGSLKVKTLYSHVN